MLDNLGVLINLIGECDGYTKVHCDNVTLYSLMIADKLGFGAKERILLKWQARLHDVGKIGVGRDILKKPGKLTEEEYDRMKLHTVMGSNILKKFTNVYGLHFGALYHHERWDGQGYPTGSRGRSIPLHARIIAIADSYDAMSSDRCYRPKCSYNYIVNEFVRGRGTQFDPQLVDIMLEILEEQHQKERIQEYSAGDIICRDDLISNASVVWGDGILPAGAIGREDEVIPAGTIYCRDDIFYRVAVAHQAA